MPAGWDLNLHEVTDEAQFAKTSFSVSENLTPAVFSCVSVFLALNGHSFKDLFIFTTATVTYYLVWTRRLDISGLFSFFSVLLALKSDSL